MSINLPLEDKAVVCLSGGMDSATTLAMALHECKAGVVAVQFQYGSSHNLVEAAAAMDLLTHYERLGYKITALEVQLPDIFKGGGSALMGEREMPNLTYEEIAEGEGPSPTVVPFRNANLIANATSLAIIHKAQRLYVGVHAEDARGWAYPDCSSEFIGAMANAVYIGSYREVRLIAPLQWDMKSDIVARGKCLQVPYELTWSCYAPVKVSPRGMIACGKCPTCVERIEAFKQNGFIDPILYNIDINWRDCEPY